ncbi:MAG: hypothetical protein M1821_007648 [Bathelium mastoideum]|nr:MAG: hypothetical protein M1821_007648 [Bathelium mastoideum]
MLISRRELAKVYQLREDYDEALRLHQENVSPLKRQRDEALGSGNYAAAEALADEFVSIGECYDRLRNPHKAYEAYREAWDNNAFLYIAADNCLGYLHRENKSSEFIRLLKDLNMRQVPEQDFCHLENYLEVSHGFRIPTFFIIGARKAAREAEELQWLVDTLREITDSRRRQRSPITAVVLEKFLAEICQYERIDQEQAVRIWEHMIRIGYFPGTSSMIGGVRANATNSLAKYEFIRILETKGTQECTEHVRRLERLAKSEKPSGTFFKGNPASMILGLWYRLNGQLDESRACFEVLVKLSIQLLSDDDPKNENLGFSIITWVLLYCGNDDGAIGLLKTMFAPKESPVEAVPEIDTASISRTPEKQNNEIIGISVETTPERKVVPDMDPSDESATNTSRSLQHKGNEIDQINTDLTSERIPTAIISNPDEGLSDAADNADTDSEAKYIASPQCDGICSRPFKLTDRYWVCRYCFDVGFCHDCLERVKADTLPIKQCNWNHEWLCMELDLKPIPEGRIYTGRGYETIEVETWKKQLKKTWQV